jgi:hypothetical protein
VPPRRGAKLSPVIRLLRHALHRRGTAFVAVLALLLAQGIGLAHGIAHPHSRGGLPAAQPLLAVDADTPAAHDDGSAQCRLLDQLAHADLLPALPALAAPLLPAEACGLGAVPQGAPRLLAWRLRARGPPSFLA